MAITSLRRTLLFIVFTCLSLCAYSQDLIAKQAPVDRRLRAVDSISIQRAVERDLEINFNNDIYKSWVTNCAHPYTDADVPDSICIDLRNFCMPTTSRRITSRYGYRPAFRRVHKGLDIKVYTGDTIVAAFDGKVRVARYDRGGYGYYLVLRHNNGLETIYGHLSKQLVTCNQEVKAGEPIGLGGNTGRSFGSHLHFETRVAGQPINPELLFNFPEQDITHDFYTFHKEKNNGNRNYMASNGQKGGSHFYKVRKGDTLSSISRKLGTSTRALSQKNRLKTTSTLRIGQILRY